MEGRVAERNTNHDCLVPAVNVPRFRDITNGVSLLEAWSVCTISPTQPSFKYRRSDRLYSVKPPTRQDTRHPHRHHQINVHERPPVQFYNSPISTEYTTPPTHTPHCINQIGTL